MDPEIEAMAKISDALYGLDEVIQHRVIRWAAERFGASLRPPVGKRGKADSAANAEGEDDGEHVNETTGSFDSIADLFVAAEPTTGPEKVLVASYWLQVLQSGADVTSFAVNKELKHLGHAVNSINKVFDVLMEQKPQLAVQLKKSGSSKQSRKRYKLTHAGVERVKGMLAVTSSAD